MGFEKFEKGGSTGWGAEPYSVIAVTKAGRISLNGMSYKALGEPEAVILFYDRATGEMALSGADEETQGAFKLRDSKGGRCPYFDCRSFFHSYGIVVEKARRLPARYDKGMVIAKVGTGGFERVKKQVAKDAEDWGRAALNKEEEAV